MILSKAEIQYFTILKAKGKLKTKPKSDFKKAADFLSAKLPIMKN